MKKLFFYVGFKLLNIVALFITLVISQFYTTLAFSLTMKGYVASNIGFKSFAAILIGLFYLLILAIFFRQAFTLHAKTSHAITLENKKLLSRFNEGVMVLSEDNDDEEALLAEPGKKEKSIRFVKF